MPQAGYVPLFSYFSDFKRIDIVEERWAILVYIKSKESRINSIFKSQRRLIEINKQFTRQRNVSYQLCFATIGRLEPNYIVYNYTSQDSCKRVQAILNQLEKLTLPRFSNKLGVYSLCSQINYLYRDIRIVYQIYIAESKEVKDYLKEILES